MIRKRIDNAIMEDVLKGMLSISTLNSSVDVLPAAAGDDVIHITGNCVVYREDLEIFLESCGPIRTTLLPAEHCG
eukprot:IDg9226t1